MVEGKKTCFCSWLTDGVQIRKVGPENAQEAPIRQRGFANGASPGGVGPWSGPVREVKLEKKHETRKETRNIKLRSNEQKNKGDLTCPWARATANLN